MNPGREPDFSSNKSSVCSTDKPVQLDDICIEGQDLADFVRQISDLAGRHQRLDEVLSTFLQLDAEKDQYAKSLDSDWRGLSYSYQKLQWRIDDIERCQKDLSNALADRRNELCSLSGNIIVCAELLNNLTEEFQQKYPPISKESMFENLVLEKIPTEDFHVDVYEDMLRDRSLIVRHRIDEVLAVLQSMTSDDYLDPYARQGSLEMKRKSWPAWAVGELQSFRVETEEIEDLVIQSPYRDKLTTMFERSGRLRKSERDLMGELHQLEGRISRREAHLQKLSLIHI